MGKNGGKDGEKPKRKKIKLAGAPSLYKKAYCQQMIDYFIEYADSDKSGIPEFLEFALAIGVTRRTLTNWKNEHDEFAEAYELCSEIQEWYLERTGLSGRNNPRMTQFLLSVKHQRAEYSRRKPIEEKVEQGLTEADRKLIAKLSERLSSKHEERVFTEGESFGEFPYDCEDEGDEDGDS